jgi:hypothetical protein
VAGTRPPRIAGKVLNLLDRTAARLTLAPAAPTDDDRYVNLLCLDRRKWLLMTHAGTLFSVGGGRPTGWLEPDRASGRRAHPVRAWRGGSADRHPRTARSHKRWAGEDRRSERPGLHERHGFHSNYVVGEAGGLANCDIPNLNRQLRRNINSSRGYARPHRLAAGWFRSSSRTLIETSLPSSYQRATYLDPGPVGTAALRAPP